MSALVSCGVDIGGTFTDCVLVDSDGGIYLGKSPTTRDNLVTGFVDALRIAAGRAGFTAAEALSLLDSVSHGTTVATNIMVQRTGAKTALVTTAGHGDAIFIQRAAGRVAGLPHTHLLDLVLGVKPEPLVTRTMVFEVDERVDLDGDVLVELRPDVIRKAVRAARDGGAEAIAVAFLWSFRNPANEEAARRVIEQEAPDAFVSISHEVAPSWGEYERIMSTVINSYVGPETGTYIRGVESALRRLGFGGAFAIMKSDGGVATAGEAAKRPVTLLSSGPAGAVAATQRMLEDMGEENAITTDMGGTSLDIGIVASGRALTVDKSVVDRFEFHLPTMDIVSIGSGGGSIAWVDEASGVLKVGPLSAGADPGPAAYGRGGDAATVTDANLVLGYLNPDYFLGGTLELDPQLAHAAVARVADRLGLTVLEAAVGIRTIVDSQMSNAIRMLMVARGFDPRRFSLIAFGGGGPVHAADYARELAVQRVVIPYADASSVWSAMGVALSDVVHIEEASEIIAEPFDSAMIGKAVVDLVASARLRVLREGVAPDAIEFEVNAKMKYKLQVHAIDVAIEFEETPDAAALRERFHTRYSELYGAGAGYRSAGVEIVGFRCTAIGRRHARGMHLSLIRSSPPHVGASAREVYWIHERASIQTAVLCEADLRPGWTGGGPAVIELPDTTVLVPPDFIAALDDRGNIHLNRAETAA